MKKNLMKMITLALTFMLLAAVPGKPAEATFTFGSASSQEKTEEPKEQDAPEEAAEPAEEAAAEPAAEAVTEEEAAAEPEEEPLAEVPAETEAETEPAAEEPAQAEPEAEPAAAQDGVPAGFADPIDVLAPQVEDIFSKASKWSKKNAPQTLADFPVLPADYQGVYEWMGGKTASFAVTDSAYTVQTEAPSFLPMSGQATAYFKDMSTLPMTSAAGVYTADKAGNAAHEAADFWRIDLSSVPFSLKTDAGILWDSSVSLSIASSGLFGPAGGTDEIRFDIHRSGEINQSIVWYIRSGELTVDIYYGNGNEVCRELTYDIKTGKLVSSEEW